MRNCFHNNTNVTNALKLDFIIIAYVCPYTNTRNCVGFNTENVVSKILKIL